MVGSSGFEVQGSVLGRLKFAIVLESVLVIDMP
jgi:hypothetical protein